MRSGIASRAFSLLYGVGPILETPGAADFSRAIARLLRISDKIVGRTVVHSSHSLPAPDSMLDANAFREIVSGRRRGAGAAVARGVLRLAEVPYTAAVQLAESALRLGRTRRSSASVCRS